MGMFFHFTSTFFSDVTRCCTARSHFAAVALALCCAVTDAFGFVGSNTATSSRHTCKGRKEHNKCINKTLKNK
jgi:hypothetical protein